MIQKRCHAGHEKITMSDFRVYYFVAANGAFIKRVGAERQGTASQHD
jgi:hypothetical protein